MEVWGLFTLVLLKIVTEYSRCFLLQTLFAGYTDNLVRVWQVTIGTR